MHVDPSALLSCIYDTLETFLPDHPGCEAADIEVARDGSSDAVRLEAGGCDFLLVLLPYGEASALGLAPQEVFTALTAPGAVQ